MIKQTITTVMMLMLATAVMAQVSIQMEIKGDKSYDSIFVKSEAKLQTKQMLRTALAPSVTLQEKEARKPGTY